MDFAVITSSGNQVVFGRKGNASHPICACVDGQGRLANEIASRPLFAENLDAVGVIIKIIARNGEFVAAWREIDAVNLSVDAQRRLKFTRRCVPDFDCSVLTPAGDEIAVYRDRRDAVRQQLAHHTMQVPRTLKQKTYRTA